MKIYHLIFPLLVGVLISGCASDEPISLSIDQSNIDEFVQTGDSKYASKEEVNSVVSTFFGQPKSRAEESSRNISLIKGKKSEPAYYIVNMPEGKGFVLVSAVKDYTPILAYSTTGNFTTEAYTLPGIADWLIDITNAIDNASEAPDSIKEKAHIQWRAMNAHMITDRVEKNGSRSSQIGDRNNHPELIPIMEDSIASWQSKGWEVYYFEDYEFTDPSRDEMIQNMQSAADWRYIEDAADLTLILRRTNYSSYICDNVMNYIKWGQDWPWNYAMPKIKIDGSYENGYVGCVGVAGGQLMKYHEYPESIDWKSMANEYKSNTPLESVYKASIFLRQLNDKLGVKYKADGTSGQTTDLINIFKGYGYTVSHQKNIDSASFPCVVRKKKSLTEGHAYVIDHFSTVNSFETIDCWTFTKKESINPCYNLKYSNMTTKMYYINWGWGGMYNGLYTNPESANPPLDGWKNGEITDYIYIKKP